MLIIIANKYVLSVYNFNYPGLLTLAHMISSVFFLDLMKSKKLVSYPDFKWDVAYKVLPITVCFLLNIVISAMALRLVNVPMFTTLRRLTLVFVMVTQRFLNKTVPSQGSVISVFVMMLGALIAGWGDLAFDLLGYLLVLINNIATALNLSLMKKIASSALGSADESNFGVVYYNSLLSIPMLLVFCLFNDNEFARARSFEFYSDPGFLLAFFSSALMAFGINYSTFWCTTVNSPLTTSVTGQAKNVLTNVLSIIIFGVDCTASLVIGLSIGLFGGFMYAWVKYKEQQNKAGRSYDVVTAQGDRDERQVEMDALLSSKRREDVSEDDLHEDLELQPQSSKPE